MFFSLNKMLGMNLKLSACKACTASLSSSTSAHPHPPPSVDERLNSPPALDYWLALAGVFCNPGTDMQCTCLLLLARCYVVFGNHW